MTIVDVFRYKKECHSKVTMANGVLSNDIVVSGGGDGGGGGGGSVTTVGVVTVGGRDDACTVVLHFF